MCSSLLTTLDDITPSSAVISVTEAGWADLSRLQLFACNPAASAGQESQIDLVPRLLLDDVTTVNLGHLIRGTGRGVSAPGGVFSPYRAFSPIQFGMQRLRSRETIQVTARITDTGVTGEFAVAVPFLPDRLAGDPGFCCEPDGPHGYLASDPQTLAAAGATATLRLTADEAGILDLDSLQIVGGLAANLANYAQDALPSVIVRSIRLPSGEQLLTGNPTGGATTVAAPAAMFAHFGRAMPGRTSVKSSSTRTTPSRSSSSADRRPQPTSSSPPVCASIRSTTTAITERTGHDTRHAEPTREGRPAIPHSEVRWRRAAGRTRTTSPVALRRLV
jgi:hypothetical protein